MAAESGPKVTERTRRGRGVVENQNTQIVEQVGNHILQQDFDRPLPARVVEHMGNEHEVETSTYAGIRGRRQQVEQSTRERVARLNRIVEDTHAGIALRLRQRSEGLAMVGMR